jgi:hypothetical protein
VQKTVNPAVHIVAHAVSAPDSVPILTHWFLFSISFSPTAKENEPQGFVQFRILHGNFRSFNFSGFHGIFRYEKWGGFFFPNPGNRLTELPFFH